jgi:UDP-N-acetylmuramoyl-L-alanyl-D-glutamate--2,6-diaminopimelate ligase
MMPAIASSRGMTLGELFGPLAPAALAARPVADLSLDSRRVGPGTLFLAVPGTRAHGLKFAAEAAAAGASLVAWEPAAGTGAPRLAEGCEAFAVPGLRAKLGEIVDRYFGEPSRRLVVVGVTGTNGKTTCTHLVAGALEGIGFRAGLIGTLGRGPFGRLEASGLTTPDVVETHRALARLAAEGLRGVAMEVSSHALDQGRVDGVRFAVAAFTNLSRDHLDYHPSLEAYAECKSRLFRRHVPGVSVINAADPFGRSLLAGLPAEARRIAVGRRPGELQGQHERVLLERCEARADGLALALSGRFGTVELRSTLVGDFNGENLALAFAVLLALDVRPRDAAAALGRVGAPPGRMEAFHDAARDVLAVVDYAHTPDALEKALAALRAHCRGRLWCVFGCGGDRDRGKRPEMGRIAERGADEVIVTDDNPRHEDGVVIVTDILAGFEDRGRARIERDRAAAIRLALAGAQPGDVVLVAGKGHEEMQVVGDERRPFSDRALLAELTGGRS